MADMQPENVSLPSSKSSMVSVRLSDVQIHPEPFPEYAQELDACTPDSATLSDASSISDISKDTDSASVSSVDWEGLEKTEEQEREDAADQSTALLLARLEQENNALAIDPKSAVSRNRGEGRPPSVHYLKKLVNGPQRQSLRYSVVPPPAMTELEFWAALVADYPQTVQRLPTLTSNKIRGGVPPPLRGVVWPSIAGAHDSFLQSEYQRLSTEVSPYDGIIGKDVGRSFPNVEMFKMKDGEGQQMLFRVLKAFSLYDDKIGYCQGLGFVVGPLLMHMTECDAFCVLVKLMEHYDIRSCYLPDLAGLHLRIYQFQQLMTRHLPTLATHLEALNIQPVFVSQWFLSFFAVTCPLPMLLRIYDVILAEGATETLTRVALSLMQRNEKKLLAFTEFEDAMHFLLSRSLWDVYAQKADDLVIDFVSLTELVSRESLTSLETGFRQSQTLTPQSALKSAASSILGRFWAGASHTPTKSGSLSLSIPTSQPRRKSSSTPSINSITASLRSLGVMVESSPSVTTIGSDPVDELEEKPLPAPIFNPDISNSSSVGERDLHRQIEELLTAISHLQHHQIEMARDLQKEREQRVEERSIAAALLQRLRKQEAEIEELAGTTSEESTAQGDALLEKAQSVFSSQEGRRASIIESKLQLREEANEWQEKHDAEVAKSTELIHRLDQQDAEHNTTKEQLREARTRIQDAHREKQRLERTVQELRGRNSPALDSPSDLYTPVSEVGELKWPPAKPGLREFKLGKSEPPRSSTPPTFNKRASSLQNQSTLATEVQASITNDALLLELASAKTAEAVAKQDLEETKAKLDALRKIMSGPISTHTRGSEAAVSPTSLSPVTHQRSADTVTPKAPTHTSSGSTGGFFYGWHKRVTA